MVKKVFLVIILILTIIFNILPVYGAKVKADDYNPESKIEATTMPQSLQDKVGPILGFIQAIGAVASVLALMIIGFKTMTGSVEEKSAYKEALPGYIIGVILVFSMTTIPNIIYHAIK